MERPTSHDVAKAAVSIALTNSRKEEEKLQDALSAQGISSAGADFGGEFNQCVKTILERAVVAAKREAVITSAHPLEGAVAGAAHEALSQISNKAMGLNVGGKIGIARKGEHLAVAIFCGIGLLHLDDLALGLSHRVVS
jgi:hypothetical protein